MADTPRPDVPPDCSRTVGDGPSGPEEKAPLPIDRETRPASRVQTPHAGLVGHQLGEFEILELLGQGGMGAVYKARQISLDRLVAIKTLQATLAGDDTYIRRFRQEAKAAALLNHPNLVSVYSAGETDGQHWFAMEYVEGETVKARLKRKVRLPAPDAITIALHVAVALDYSWRKASLIHRDVKPDNIFLSGEGEVKLGDLGLAKSLEQNQELTQTGASMGTPLYISPEQVLGAKDVDLRADIYSLGCTLYHLLSGQPPFAARSAMALMMQHVSAPVPDLRGVWPECPEELALALLRMMQKEPGNRQQSYDEVSADLRSAYHELCGRSAPSLIDVTQPPAPKKRRAAPVAFLACAALGLCAAGAATFFRLPLKDVLEGLSGAATISAATREAPFVNTLGMKFVPVPILGGPTNGQRVLFSVWDTRVQDYEVFAKETNRDWPKPSFEQGPAHPAVMLTWIDAQAFCDWLTRREQATGRLSAGFRYRLPRDHEWSCAVGIGDRENAATLPSDKSQRISDAFPWGGTWPPPATAGNYHGGEDGFVNTSPVGSFGANRFGLCDMGGNVWQWCEDHFEKGSMGRVQRGDSWAQHDRDGLLSSNRASGKAGRSNEYGFRCVLAPASTGSALAGSAPSSAFGPPSL